MAGQRVLGRVRLSRQAEESTSEARQREAIEQWATMHGHEIVGWAVDMDVSGSVSPFEAPQLGPWLREDRLGEWDILCAYRLDRVARRVVPLNALFGLVMDNGKSLVSVSESIDLGTWVGRMVANVIAGVAEGELEAITERTRGSQQKLREVGRWHGGKPPYGYSAVQRGDGWYLEIDPEQAEVVQSIVERVSDGNSMRSVTLELNNRGIASPRGSRWITATVRNMLRSRWIIGQVEHNGRVVTDDSGMPLQRAEPLIGYREWQELQGILDGRQRRKVRSNGTGLLLHVAHCDGCGEPLYHHAMVDKGKQYRYWRCSGRALKQNGCTARNIRAGDLEEFVEQYLLEEIGDLERTERVWMPGESHDDELAQVESAIARARKEADLGLYDDDEDGYLARMSALVERRKSLESAPVRSAGYEYRGTGETYRQAWERMDTADRRSLLADSGITVRASARPFTADLNVPADILTRRFPGYQAADDASHGR